MGIRPLHGSISSHPAVQGLDAALAPAQSSPTPSGPRTPGATAPRPLDEIDRVAAGGIVDLHADTPLHNLDLEGDGHPGLMMRIWWAILDFLGIFFPKLRNFRREVTLDSIEREGRGLQVMSEVTQGMPPFFTASFKAYTGVIADYPDAANDTPLNASLFQVGWTYRQVHEHSKHLRLAKDARSAVGAIRDGRVAVQIGIEGAFPLEVHPGDVEAFRRLRHTKNALPAGMPLPTEEQIATVEGRLAYYASLGVAYIGLNHLGSSCFSGSDLAFAQNRHSGLSTDGRRMVRSLDRAGVMLDTAHASQRSQNDIAEMVERGEYTLPLLVSHGLVQLDGAEPNWRSTNDRLLRAVRATGGVIGVMFARQYLPHGGSGDPNLVVRDIVDQIDTIKARIGIDYVAFGSDADGFVGLPFRDLTECVQKVMAEMRRRGYSDEEIIKIRGGNYLHALARRDAIMARRARQAQGARTPEQALRPQAATTR